MNMDIHTHTHVVMLQRHVSSSLLEIHRVIIANSLLLLMPNRGKGGGKPADDEETPGTDRRLPREPLGYITGLFLSMVAHGIGECGQMIDEKERAKAKPHLQGFLSLEIMIDQLPMLTEKGLRELMVSLSCELSFRGDVREQNEEVQLEYEANGGKGSAFPPEDLIEIVRSRGSRGDGHGDARGARDAEADEEEDEYRIPPGEGDRYWNEYGEEQFYEA